VLKTVKRGAVLVLDALRRADMELALVALDAAVGGVLGFTGDAGFTELTGHVGLGVGLLAGGEHEEKKGGDQGGVRHGRRVIQRGCARRACVQEAEVTQQGGPP
jgi:hypothetical protein